MPDPAPDSPPDPSMEDILASIRRILDEDPAAATEHDELVLDESMMIDPPASPAASPLVASPAPAPAVTAPAVTALAASVPAASALLEPQAAEQATASMRHLARIAAERTTRISQGGPTIEDLVRAELRPLLKDWLDAHLPPLIERVVRGEIERLVSRAAS